MKKELVIGIDIGGTNTDFGIVDKEGNILWNDSIKTNKYNEVEPFITDLTSKIKTGLAKFRENFIVKGIGVGAPNGNFFTGNIEFAPNLKWKGIIPLADLISKELFLPVTLTNDANAAALGEMIYGAAKGMKDFIVITLGTGLGSGIVVNGKLLYGHDGFAGELGHTVVFSEGRLCGCGKNGCLETYASATGIVTTAIEILNNSKEPSLLRNIKFTEGEEKLSSKDIFQAAEKGDKIALEIFEYTGKILGIKLADAVAFSSPEAIILFGGLANAGKFIFTPTKKYMEYYLLPFFRNKIKLLPSLLNDQNAAILGAAALAWGKE
ncbi:MAG: ROK family protein [Bacteroidetes bacterium]|nr:ROK family protein [Bacteroidota bacterium]